MRKQSLSVLSSLCLAFVSLLVTEAGLNAQQTIQSATPTADNAQSAAGAPARIEEALAASDALLVQYRQSGNREAEANTLCAIANSYNALHQQQRSIENLQSALAIWRDLGDRGEEAATLAHVGDVYRGWGFPEQANRFYRDALAVYPPIDRAGRAATLNNLGLTYFSLHNKKKCLEYLNEALASYRELQNRRGEALTLTNLGTAYNFLLDDPLKALDLLQEAVTKLELLDDPDNEANALDLSGVVWLNLQKPEMASMSFHRALSLFTVAHDPQGVASARKHMKALGEPEIIASAH